MRIVAYCWFTLIMWLTSMWPDVTPVLKLRGFLLRVCFRSCGRNLQIAGGVRITFTTRIDMGNDVYLAPGCWVQGIGGVTFGDEVMLGPYTVLASTNHLKKDGSYRFGGGEPAPIALGHGAWTGAHVVITAGVTIGEGAAVAAGAVVTSDVPDHTIVGGVPAKVIKTESSAEPLVHH